MPRPTRVVSSIFALAVALAAAPAVAQVVVVPLDPVDPGGIVPTDPVTGFEPLPLDPNAAWEPILIDPLDPDVVMPGPDATLDGSEPGFVALAPGSVVGEDVTRVKEDEVTAGTGAVLKGLDKLAGTVVDLTLANGQTVGLGWLQITLGECRYPVDNPAGDAYAWLVIREEAGEAPVFEGWMIASSPALNALDHARFDVWVETCTGAEEVAADEGAPE